MAMGRTPQIQMQMRDGDELTLDIIDYFYQSDCYDSSDCNTYTYINIIFNRHDIENEIEIDSCELLPKLAQLNGGTCRLITRLGDVCELYGPMHTQRPHERSREEAP